MHDEKASGLFHVEGGCSHSDRGLRGQTRLDIDEDGRTGKVRASFTDALLGLVIPAIKFVVRGKGWVLDADNGCDTRKDSSRHPDFPLARRQLYKLVNLFVKWLRTKAPTDVRESIDSLKCRVAVTCLSINRHDPWNNDTLGGF